MALTQVTSNMLEPNAQFMGFKNRIINGAMAIDQRNAGAAITVVSNMYTLDRFFACRGGFASGMQVQRVAGFLGKQYAARLQRVSGNTSTAALAYAQVFESCNVLDLAGTTVTVSFDVRTGANYSGGQLTAELDTATVIDQTSTQLFAGTWTGIATQTSSVTISSTATRYSATFNVPSNMQSMALQFYWIPSGTAGANDYVEITGVQLEKGSTATSFDYRPYGTELALCQRYLPAFATLNASAWVTSAVNAYAEIQFPVSTRVNCTGCVIASVGGFNVYSVAVANITATAMAFNSGYQNGARVSVTVAGGLTAGQGTVLNSNSTLIYFTGCEL